jgi:hypothetical protein
LTLFRYKTLAAERHHHRSGTLVKLLTSNIQASFTDRDPMREAALPPFKTLVPAGSSADQWQNREPEKWHSPVGLSWPLS